MNRLKIVLALATLTAMLLSGGAWSQERNYINGRSAGDSGPPFSGAVQVGDTLYISGMLGLQNGQVPADPRTEARLMLDSVKAAVEAAGFTMDDIVNVTIYCSDVSHYDAFNEVYRTYFTREFPARAFIGSGTLLFNARFEMQSIAVKR
ncbi:MAG: Rid family hydrolase [Gammaproteobacteria bacterium]